MVLFLFTSGGSSDIEQAEAGGFSLLGERSMKLSAFAMMLWLSRFTLIASNHNDIAWDCELMVKYPIVLDRVLDAGFNVNPPSVVNLGSRPRPVHSRHQWAWGMEPCNLVNVVVWIQWGYFNLNWPCGVWLTAHQLMQ